MSISVIILYAFAALALLSALYVAFTRNLLYAAFGLIVAFLGVAGIFMMLGATFIAISQILVYVGGILVLIVFGIMLTNRLKGQRVVSKTYNKLLGGLACAGLLIIFYKAILQANFSAMSWISSSAESIQPDVKTFGLGLMTEYVLAFEVIGILLLLALIGAVKIAGSKGKEVENAA